MAMFDLTGRTAIITGASAGLGRQFSLALAGQGANVVLFARRREKLEEVAKECEARGAKTLVCPGSVTVDADVNACVEAAINEFGQIDILVNNAGGAKCGPILDFDADDFNWTMDYDVTGTFRFTKAAGKYMIERGYGRIINLGSILGRGGLKEIPICDYAAAKGAIINLTRQTAVEWADKGITCNVICPGFFGSESNSDANMEVMRPWIIQHTPIGREGLEGELDSAVIFLAADESSYVTGQVIGVDGGWTAK